MDSLYSKEVGSGATPMVVLPGLAGTTRYWEGRISSLLPLFHVTLIDPLGFGQSPKPDLDYSLERHMDAMAETLRDRPPLTLVGHSFGAMLSLAYAVKYPEQINRLILISLPVFRSYQEAITHFRQIPTAERWFMTHEALAAVACVLARRVFKRLVPRLLPEMPREIAEDLSLHTWRSFTSSLWEIVYNHQAGDDARQLSIGIPVRCIHGETDTTAPLANVRQLVAGLTNWELTVLPGIDHHPLLHAQDETLKAIITTCNPATKTVVHL